ncbi:hypothetical protein [Methylovulum sp.]|uniref:hypothetical protein n=1 Tax=Methylovulum sp. TaxID=1916980 RepID=UPI00262A1EE4|nr:hypothetical protein [Methylovulum sp.]MDD5126269.1 hypothetical protein [Methylovulum sp.]
MSGAPLTVTLGGVTVIKTTDLKTENSYVLGGSVADYLDVFGKDILGRMQPHTDWLNARYESGLDPYSKASSGPILAECQAMDRKGRLLHGVN